MRKAATVGLLHSARRTAALASARLVVPVIECRALLVVRGACRSTPPRASPGGSQGWGGRGPGVALPAHQPLVPLVRNCRVASLLQQGRGLEDGPCDVVVGGRLLRVVDGELLQRLLGCLSPGWAVLERGAFLTEAPSPEALLSLVSVSSRLDGGLESGIKVRLLDSDVAESFPQGLGLLVAKVLLILVLA